MSKITELLSRAEAERGAMRVHEASGFNSGGPATLQARGVAPQTGPSTVPESWEQALELVKRQLEAYEQRAAHQAADAVRLRAQLGSAERLATEAGEERTRLKQQLERSTHTAAAIEAEKAMWARQLESLRECQVLSHTARMLEHELRAAGALLAEIRQSHVQVTDELAHQQARRQRLEQDLQAVRFKLGQALACTSTTEPSPTS